MKASIMIDIIKNELDKHGDFEIGLAFDVMNEGGSGFSDFDILKIMKPKKFFDPDDSRRNNKISVVLDSHDYRFFNKIEIENFKMKLLKW